MKKIILYIVLGVVVLAVLIKIITGSDPEYGTKAEVTVPAVSDLKSTVKNVTFIIDNSGSMRGYVDFSGNKEQFKDANNKKMLLAKTGEFMGNCENKLHAKTIAYCNGKEYNTEQTLRNLNDYSAFSGPITEVDSLIGKASKAVKGDSSLCVIVSDLILSYGKKTLIEKNDKYYNLNNLPTMKAQAYTRFLTLKKEGKGVLIAKYEGDFNGSYYYNYTENLDPCEFKDSLMTDRPFYFMVIGSSKAIKDLCNSGCLPSNSKVIFSSLELDKDDMVCEKYTVTQPASQTQWTLGCPDKKKKTEAAKKIYSVTMKKNLKDAVSRFNFSFDKFKIPPYIDTTLTAEFDRNKLQSVSPLTDNSSFTVTTVPFNKLSKVDPVKVEFTSPRYVNYESSFTRDDVKTPLSGMVGRTWGFEVIVEALYDAYGIHKTDKNVVMSLEFIINTK